MRITLVCGLLAAVARVATAQSPAVRGDHARWRFGHSVAPDLGGQMGLGLALGVGFQAPDGPGPSTLTGAFGADLRYGTTGSRSAALGLVAPALWRNWRVLALVRTERLERTPYFGPGNAGRAADSLEGRYGSLYYRYELLRTTGLAAAQRRIAGPLWFYAGAQARHYRTRSLNEPASLYTLDFGAGADSTRWSGLEGRAGLVLDTRDDWATPRRGLLLEAIMATGRLTHTVHDSTSSYRRWLLGAREFVTLGDSARSVLALRQRLSVARDTLPFFLAYEQLTTWAPDDGVVGSHTIRLHGGGNQLASNTFIASAEWRRKLMDSTDEPKQPVGLWGMVFVDGGMLWEPRTSASLKRTAWTLGVGLRLQTGRRSLTGLDIGWGDTGPNVNVTSSFGF